VAPVELHRRTGGNPFYVTEALAAPAEHVPASVRLAVLARASRLDDGARRVVDAVAVVPGHAEAWLIEAMVQPAPNDVDTAVGRGVLVPVEGGYRFRHELARLAIETQVPSAVRRDLHRRALAALQERPGIDPARLVHHAAHAGDEVALARAALDASRLASARASHREAVRFGEQALAAAHAVEPDELAGLKVTMGFSLVSCDRGDEAAALLGEAIEHWRQRGDEQREAAALSALATLLVGAGRTAEGVAATERARQLLERHPAGLELATAYLRLTSLHMLARERDQAVQWGERALALAVELGSVELQGRVLIESGIADVVAGRTEGQARVRHGIELGRRHDLPALVSIGLGQLGSGCGEMRGYADAVPALVESIQVGAERGYEMNRRYSVAWLGRCRFDLGQWDEAEALLRDALAGPRSAAITRFVALNTLGWLRARRGDDDAWPPLDEALAIARATSHLQRLWPSAVARAEAGWLQGDLSPHLDLVEEVLELALRCQHGVAIGELGWWLARAGRDGPDPSAAAEPFSLSLAGDHLGAAAGFDGLGCPYDAAREQVLAGDTAYLRQALATFDRLGAAPAAARTRAELVGRGLRVRTGRTRASSAAAPTAAGLSEREVEVARLVAAGFSNPEIAAALYISRKTAEHHVSSILAKLGVTRRAEAAAALVRLGVVGG
jgi:DNA-binding CsgD family transcriptional regulator/tetratricopeptide (TPR) repeat protein